MVVSTFPTSHDVADPALAASPWWTATAGRDAIAWCTDTGYLTPEALGQLRGARIPGPRVQPRRADARAQAVSAFLRARVGGDTGHLSNAQAADALPLLVTDDTETVVALHLSEKNNTPGCASARWRTRWAPPSTDDDGAGGAHGGRAAHHMRGEPGRSRSRSPVAAGPARRRAHGPAPSAGGRSSRPGIRLTLAQLALQLHRHGDRHQHRDRVRHGLRALTPGSPSTRLRMATTGASARPSRHRPKNVARHMRPVVCRGKVGDRSDARERQRHALEAQRNEVAIRMTSGVVTKEQGNARTNANVSTHTHATMPKAALRAKRSLPHAAGFRPAP